MGLSSKTGSLYRWCAGNAKKSIAAAVLLAVGAIAAYAILAEGGRTDAGRSPSPPSPSREQRDAHDSGDDLTKRELAVKKGDSLFTILKACGIDARGIHALSQAVSHLYDLAEIVPGRAIRVWTRGESPARLVRLIYDIDPLKYLEVIPEGESFKALMQTRRNEIFPERTQGVIKSSLYESAVRAGLDPEIVMDLTEIFGWDINFFTDIQEGDTFTVLSERYTIEGTPAGCGRVLAARFVLQDRTHTAIYHDDGNGRGGYYDEHGNPIRKLFLKAPLHYRRISSRFSPNRIHPVFHDARPHLGVDYAAPPGTPVVALGKGRITRCGWAGGFGKAITVEHPGGYRTHYGHLSAFAKGIARGKRVEQGDVIGYVGRTGIATGPHLDFRVQHQGRYVNPLRLAPVTVPNLTGTALAEFRQVSRKRLATLDGPHRQGVPDSNL